MPGSLEEEESKLEAMGDDFEMVLSLDKSPSEIKGEIQSRTTSVAETECSQYVRMP